MFKQFKRLFNSTGQTDALLAAEAAAQKAQEAITLGPYADQQYPEEVMRANYAAAYETAQLMKSTGPRSQPASRRCLHKTALRIMSGRPAIGSWRSWAHA